MNLPTHLKDPAQTKHQRLYDTVNSLISFLEEKFPQSDEPKEEWNENVETCSGCDIQWKKIGKSCPVCFKPPEKRISPPYPEYHPDDCKPHWESDYAAIWDKYYNNNSRYCAEDARQDILELIRGLMKV